MRATLRASAGKGDGTCQKTGGVRNDHRDSGGTYIVAGWTYLVACGVKPHFDDREEVRRAMGIFNGNGE
ncbi:MAG: hypothetical protein LIO85_11415 [Rikenellaceae bacterium]|nr:hypothetical protein [Rikenellaceae bacterium]